MYRLVPPCTVQVQGSTYWYVLVCTVIGITYVGTYWYVPFWGFSYRHVPSKVRTGTYQYIPSCTALYQVYRIPDVGIIIGKIIYNIIESKYDILAPSLNLWYQSSAKWAVHILHIGNNVCIFCISCILFCIFCILHAILSKVFKTCILIAYFTYFLAYYFAYSAYWFELHIVHILHINCHILHIVSHIIWHILHIDFHCIFCILCI
jgi:hypothetical protein